MLIELDRLVWILLAVLFEILVRLRDLQAQLRYAEASGAGLSRLVTRKSV